MYPYINFLGRQIGTYGVFLTLGFILVGLFACLKGKRIGLLTEDVFIVAGFVLAFALIGGSALYILVTYTFAQIINMIQQGNLSFLGSGIVFYGGLLGGLLGAAIGIRVAGCKFDPLGRSVIPYIPLGHAIGRIGCVMAGCCYGFSYSGPFAIYYTKSVSGIDKTQGCFPVQPLESLINIGIFIFLLWYDKRVKQGKKLLFCYLGLYAVARFFLEMLRADVIRGVWKCVSTSQIISIILMIVSVVGMFWNKGTDKAM